MAINVADLIKSMVAAAEGAAKGHAADLKNYIEARVRLMAQGAVQIAADRLAGKITDDDAKFAFQEIAESEKTQVRAVAVTLKAAAQDAVNAALDIAAKAINSAVGFVLI